MNEETRRAARLAAASGAADYREAAAIEFPSLSGRARDELARLGFERAVRDYMRIYRHGHSSPVPVLERSYYISAEGTTGRWEHLRECTVLEVRSIADAYRVREAANAMWAERYERLATEMETRSVATVAELPEALVEEILEGAPVPSG